MIKNLYIAVYQANKSQYSVQNQFKICIFGSKSVQNLISFEMKTQSELKQFSSGDYEYIYIYYKYDGNTIRINPKIGFTVNNYVDKLTLID